MTTARPKNSGSEPRTSATATIRPQNATASGLARVTRNEA